MAAKAEETVRAAPAPHARCWRHFTLTSDFELSHQQQQAVAVAAAAAPVGRFGSCSTCEQSVPLGTYLPGMYVDKTRLRTSQVTGHRRKNSQGSPKKKQKLDKTNVSKHFRFCLDTCAEALLLCCTSIDTITCCR